MVYELNKKTQSVIWIIAGAVLMALALLVMSLIFGGEGMGGVLLNSSLETSGDIFNILVYD